MKIGYARVSTADQNLDLQLDALTAAGCEKIYSEHISGKNADRPELAQCLRALRKDDVLVVWRLDRLGRSTKDLLQIVEDLKSREIGFQSLTEALDTQSPAGRLIFHVLGALAEFEHAIIKERVRAGLAASRARGRLGGRAHKLSTADTRKARAMLVDPTITKSEVARHFKVSRPTLDAALARLDDSQ